jgi:hypothetical protein
MSNVFYTRCLFIMWTHIPIRLLLSPYNTKTQNIYNNIIYGDINRSNTNTIGYTNFQLKMQFFWKISWETLKGRSFESTNHLINLTYYGNCTKKKFQSNHSKKIIVYTNEPIFFQIHFLRNCTKIIEECSIYQKWKFI